MVMKSGVSRPHWMRRPIGFCPANDARTSDSFTIATRGASFVSESAKSRPAFNGMAIVLK